MTTPMSLQPWSWQIFRLNTNVEVIFPNVCLWRRSLCSNLVLTLKKMYRATFICQYGLCCCNMALVSFLLFRKNLSNLRDFFGKIVYRPPPGEKFPVRLWSRLFQGIHYSANYTICIYIDTRDNHQILSRSQPARAFYCKRAGHCIVGNNNVAPRNKLYTCQKSTALAPTAQGTHAKRTNLISIWHLTTETGNGLCESLLK